MEKDRRTKILSVVAIIIALLGISISYAAMSTTMDIKGIANLDNGGSWDIHFANLSNVKTTGSAIEKKSPVIKNDSYIGDFDIVFKKQNDSIEYDFDIVNDGTIDAKLSSLTYLHPKCFSSNNITSENDLSKICDAIEYSITTDNGILLSDGSELLSKKIMRVRLVIKYTGSFIPSDDVTINDLGVVLLYSQK